jgi:uncharacterized membrane protein
MNQPTAGFRPQNSSQLPFGPTTILLGAGAAILYGLSRRSKSGAAVATAGGVLAFAAAKSHSSSPQSARATFLVNASPQKAYDLWHNFENLPRFMVHLKSVRRLEDKRSEWIARGPMDREIHWNAETTEDTPNQRIAWKTLPGSDIQTSGSVQFCPDPHNRGTFVTAEIQYSLPGGALASVPASIFGKHPEFLIREDLRRFKALLEAGEIPTTVGQTHGPRGLHGHVGQVLFRETSNQPQPQAPLAKSA